MTAKTILVQLHHKIETFEAINKRLVLVVQDCLADYMTKNFSFGHLANPARLGDSMHFHCYSLTREKSGFTMRLVNRMSTNRAGIETCLGMQATAVVELQVIIDALQHRIGKDTRLVLSGGDIPQTPPVSPTE